MGEGSVPHDHYVYTGRTFSIFEAPQIVSVDCGWLVGFVFPLTAAHAPWLQWSVICSSGSANQCPVEKKMA